MLWICQDLPRIFSCRPQAVAALGTGFSSRIRVISNCRSFFSTPWHYHQHCFSLSLLSISIAQHQHCLTLALLSLSIDLSQHYLDLALLCIGIAQYYYQLALSLFSIVIISIAKHHSVVQSYMTSRQRRSENSIFSLVLYTNSAKIEKVPFNLKLKKSP